MDSEPKDEAQEAKNSYSASAAMCLGIALCSFPVELIYKNRPAPPFELALLTTSLIGFSVFYFLRSSHRSSS